MLDDYGIINSLLFNEKIQPSPEGVLRTLGFVHLYTASGLHLIALEHHLNRMNIKSFTLQKLLRLSFWIFLILLWKLQDFRLGFARVLVLFFLKALAKSQGYRWQLFYPLFLAFCFDFAIGIDAGWDHYYLALLGGMIGLQSAQKKSPFTQHLYLSVGSWLMTAPLDLLHHHEIAWMTPIWSMITIPPIALFLYPASVVSYFVLGRIPETLIEIWNWGTRTLLQIVDLGFTFSFAHSHAVWIALALAIAVTIIFYWIRDYFYRKIIFISIAFILLAVRFLNTPPRIELIQLDVGQGDSLLIHTPELTEMIDLGSAKKLKSDTWIHRLTHHGASGVNTVLFSHLDEDHVGGLKYFLPWVPLERVQVSMNLIRTDRISSWLSEFPHTQLCYDHCFTLGVTDSIPTGKPKKKYDGNDLMTTAIIPVSETETYIALGDSNSTQEEKFLNRWAPTLNRYPHRYLKISHHGSRFSSNHDFLRSINPKLAVISVGKRNSYHHPHPTVLKNLKYMNQIPIHRTDHDGDFVLRR